MKQLFAIIALLSALSVQRIFADNCSATVQCPNGMTATCSRSDSVFAGAGSCQNSPDNEYVCALNAVCTKSSSTQGSCYGQIESIASGAVIGIYNTTYICCNSKGYAVETENANDCN